MLSGVGDPGAVTYKRTRRGRAGIDAAVEHVLAHRGAPHRVVDFSPYGYDERQYGSPGFDLPVGCLMRTPHGEYPEYHTSLDDPDFVRPEARRHARGRDGGGRPWKRRRLRNGSGARAAALRRALPTGPVPGPSMALLWTLNPRRSLVLDSAGRAGVPFARSTTRRHAARAGLLPSGRTHVDAPDPAPRAFNPNRETAARARATLDRRRAAIP